MIGWIDRQIFELNSQRFILSSTDCTYTALQCGFSEEDEANSLDVQAINQLKEGELVNGWMDGCLSTTTTSTISTSTVALKQSVDSHTLRQGWIKKKRSGENKTYTV